MKTEAELIQSAVEKSIENDFVTEDLNRTHPKSTSDVGDWISNYIQEGPL